MEPITTALGVAKLFGLDKKIGALLGGERGAAVAEKVVDIARTFTGTDKVDQMQEVIKANPELAAKLEMQLNDLCLREMELVFADITNARSMQVEALHQEDLFSKRFLYYFASAWSLFAMVYIMCVTFIAIPPGNVRYADSMQTFILSSVVAVIICFFYGSSRTSQRKDDTVFTAISRSK